MSRTAAEAERAEGRLGTAMPRTLGALFGWRVRRSPDAPAHWVPDGHGRWATRTWAEVAVCVDEIAAGLLSLGLPAQAVVAAATSCRPEAVLVAWGVARAGASVAGVHPDAPAGDLTDLLRRTSASVLFAQDGAQLAKVREHWARLDGLQAVVVLDAAVVGPDSVHAGDRRVLSLRELRERGRELLQAEPDVVSDAVQRSAADHREPGRSTAGAAAWGPAGLGIEAAPTELLRARDVHLLCVPPAHPLARTWLVTQLVVGFATAPVDDVPGLAAALPVVRPTAVVALAPTVRRLRAGFGLELACGSGTGARATRWALRARARPDADPDGGAGADRWVRAVRRSAAGALLLPWARTRLGGRLRCVVTGRPGPDPTVRAWFASLGVPVLTGQDGGTPVPQPDGPDRSDEPDGAGGAERVLVLSTGRRVDPGPVEARFASSCPYVGHLVLHGQGRPYLAALVTLDADAMATWAQHHGMAGERYAQVVASVSAHAMVQRHLDELNADLPPEDRVRRFCVLPQELTVADGALGAELEVRRSAVEARYAAQLDSLYPADPTDPAGPTDPGEPGGLGHPAAGADPGPGPVVH